jgi:hypothetical protein
MEDTFTTPPISTTANHKQKEASFTESGIGIGLGDEEDCDEDDIFKEEIGKENDDDLWNSSSISQKGSFSSISSNSADENDVGHSSSSSASVSGIGSRLARISSPMQHHLQRNGVLVASKLRM